jgi:uncharacterized membrane protein (UPF0127 family)
MKMVAVLLSAIVLAQAGNISFQKKKIRVGNQILTVEIADNDERRQRGLMFRKELKPNEGMLFEFENEQQLAFWMKNTLIPLSIGYFDGHRRFVNSLEMVPERPGTPDYSHKRYASWGPAKYALEMPADWFKKRSLDRGKSTFEYESP